jgi:hypothetical protein
LGWVGYIRIQGIGSVRSLALKLKSVAREWRMENGEWITYTSPVPRLMNFRGSLYIERERERVNF